MSDKKLELILTELNGTPITINFNLVAAKKPIPNETKLELTELKEIADTFNLWLYHDRYNDLLIEKREGAQTHWSASAEFNPKASTAITLSDSSTKLYLSGSHIITVVQNIETIEKALKNNKVTLHDEGLEKISHNKTEAKAKFHSFLKKTL